MIILLFYTVLYFVNHKHTRPQMSECYCTVVTVVGWTHGGKSLLVGVVELHFWDLNVAVYKPQCGCLLVFSLWFMWSKSVSKESGLVFDACAFTVAGKPHHGPLAWRQKKCQKELHTCGSEGHTVVTACTTNAHLTSLFCGARTLHVADHCNASGSVQSALDSFLASIPHPHCPETFKVFITESDSDTGLDSVFKAPFPSSHQVQTLLYSVRDRHKPGLVEL